MGELPPHCQSHCLTGAGDGGGCSRGNKRALRRQRSRGAGLPASQMHVLRVRAWTVPRQVWSDLRPTFPPGGGRAPLLSPLPKWRSRFFSSCSESSSRTRHRSPQLRQRTASRDSRNLEEAARAPERLLRSAVARLKSRDGGGGGTWGPPQPPGRADAHQGRARAVHVCVFRLSAEVCLA